MGRGLGGGPRGRQVVVLTASGGARGDSEPEEGVCGRNACLRAPPQPQGLSHAHAGRMFARGLCGPSSGMDKAGPLTWASGCFSLPSQGSQLSLLPTTVMVINHKTGHITLWTLHCTRHPLAPGITSKLPWPRGFCATWPQPAPRCLFSPVSEL